MRGADDPRRRSLPPLVPHQGSRQFDRTSSAQAMADQGLEGIDVRHVHTENLLQEHLIVRRLGRIAKRCSDVLYINQDIPIEDIQIISVVIEEFVDGFHHGKEEKAYFPVTKYKNSFSEDIRKFLIEHEFARRIAKMLRRELDNLIDHDLYNKTRE